MDISEALVAHLEDDETVSELVGERIYSLELPEERTLPAIVYERQTTPQTHISRYAKPYYRLRCIAYTYALAWQVAEAVRQSCEKYHGNLGEFVHAFIMVEDLRDDKFTPVPHPGTRQVSVYLRVWFQQP